MGGLGLIGNIKLVAFDFDGVFTDNTVYVTEQGVEMVRCWRGDGIGIQKLKKLGIEYLVISSEANPIVRVRCGKLGIPCVENCKNKLHTLLKRVDGRFQMSEVAYVGNDINDLECLQAVGFPIIVHDAQSDLVEQLANIPNIYATKACGGHGAVREVCDLVERMVQCH